MKAKELAASWESESVAIAALKASSQVPKVTRTWFGMLPSCLRSSLQISGYRMHTMLGFRFPMPILWMSDRKPSSIVLATITSPTWHRTGFRVLGFFAF